ncbi:hypothetical protein TNCV_3339461 [Trichonephila clavipes]|nr:hypothetical protein TNCV_3339461 [Trichonephila clavipes]
MSFTQRSVSGRPRQTSRQEDRHIVRNARAQPTALSATIQAQIVKSPIFCERRIRWPPLPCKFKAFLLSHLPVDGVRFLGGQKGVALQLQDARVGVGSTKDFDRCWEWLRYNTHPSTPPFRVVPRISKLDSSGMEPGRP